MKVYEFRKDLKQAFDAALRGEEVSIERGGISFSLKAEGVVGTDSSNTAPIKPVVADAKSNFGFCKEGHPIPAGRDKCLGKGCKYS